MTGSTSYVHHQNGYVDTAPNYGPVLSKIVERASSSPAVIRAEKVLELLPDCELRPRLDGSVELIRNATPFTYLVEISHNKWHIQLFSNHGNCTLFKGTYSDDPITDAQEIVEAVRGAMG